MITYLQGIQRDLSKDPCQGIATLSKMRTIEVDHYVPKGKTMRSKSIVQVGVPARSRNSGELRSLSEFVGNAELGVPLTSPPSQVE